MSMRVACTCGAIWETPSGTEALTCAKCGRSVPAPLDAASLPPQNERGDPGFSASSANTPSDPDNGSIVSLGDIARCELIRDTEGREWWKMACVCGKRVRSPARTQQPYGKCPKCGRRLKLPGYLLSRPPVLISAAPGDKPVIAADKNPKPAEAPKAETSPKKENREVDAESETRDVVPLRDEQIPTLLDDESETVVVEAVLADMRVNQAAFQRVANSLRPTHINGESSGRISAWPLAGMIRRALAAFVDLTLAVMLAGIVVVLASVDVLPPALLRGEVVFLLLILAGWLNDGVLQLLLGETLGKRLVVVVTRTLDGAELSVLRLLLRALLKWLIVPGWLIALIDPNERALHDLICGTLVLRGRNKR